MKGKDRTTGLQLTFDGESFEQLEAAVKECVLAGKYDQLGDEESKDGLRLRRGLDLLGEWCQSQQKAAPSSPEAWEAALASGLSVLLARCSLLLEWEQARPGTVSAQVMASLPTEVFADSLLNKCPWNSDGDHSDDIPSAADLDLLKHLAVHRTLLAAGHYRIFETPGKDLEQIEQQLRRVSATIEAALGRLDDGTRRFRSVRGLIAFQRGRVARARGGRHLRHAEHLLSDALEAYELAAFEQPIQAGARPSRPRQEAGWGTARHERARFRASCTMLQLAYLNYCRGFIQRCLRQVREARLFALGGSNAHLETEISLVEISARVALLGPVPTGGPAVDRSEFRNVKEELVLIIAEAKKQRRPEYALMGRYQELLLEQRVTRSARQGTLSASYSHLIEQIDELGRVATEKEQMASWFGSEVPWKRNDYWRASAEILRLSVQLDHARLEHSLTLQRNIVTSTVRRSKGLLGSLPPTDYENLRVQTLLCLAEAYVLKRDPMGAARFLEDADGILASAGELGGFTAHTPASILWRLVRAEVLVLGGNPFAARSILRLVEEEFMPTCEDPSIHWRYEHVRAALGAAYTIWDHEIEALQGRARWTTPLHQLEEALIRAGERKVGKNATPRMLAEYLGVEPAVIERVRIRKRERAGMADEVETKARKRG